MISKKMQSKINEQINAELWSAYLYLSMAMDAEAKALRGIANWFYIQWLEEQDHARIFQNYMTAQGARVMLKPIPEVQIEWRNALDMFRDTLKHEEEVTAMIKDLVQLALDENDFATLSRLQWFIDEQVEEEDTASQMVIDFDRAGNDFRAIHEMDEEMAERQYKKASPLK